MGGLLQGLQETVTRTEHLHHVHLAEPLLVRVDGRTGMGVITRSAPGEAVRGTEEKPTEE